MRIQRRGFSVSPAAERMIYEYGCIGIIYSFFFWTLLNSICCILLFAAWLLLAKKSFDFSSYRSRLVLLFAGLYLVLLAGIFYTSNMAEGLSRLQEKAPILVFPLIFGTTTMLSGSLVKKIATHFIIGATISAVCSIIAGVIHYVHTGQVASATGRGLLVFPDTYPYLMGLSALLSLIMLFSGITSLTANNKWLQLSITGILSIHIFLLNTRLVTACWIVTVLIMLFCLIRTLLWRVLSFVILISTAALMIYAVPPLHQQWQEFFISSEERTIPLDQDASLGKSWGGGSIREAIWKCSGDIIRRHWLAGVGTGDIQDSLQQAYENRKFYFASRYNRYNAHNQYLQLMIGHGLPGLLIFLACLIAPVGMLLAGTRRFALFSDPITICYIAFLCLFCIICFTEVILDINKGIIWYAFFNAVFAFAIPLRNFSTNQNRFNPHGKKAS